jgi:hypothetical protein
MHLLATFGVVAVVSLRARRPAAVLGITAYAGLCDVFWRSTSAQGPWEGAKYALIIGFSAVLIRFVRRPQQAGLPLLLMLLLIPGAALGVLELGPTVVRQFLVANLFGLIALALGVLACSNIRVTASDIRYLYLAALGPCVSVATVATLSTLSASDIKFQDASNFTTSGGFGPVQVSALLSFGALLCLLLLLQANVPALTRLLLLATAVWLVAQAVLTFSRGGLFSLVLALSCVGIAALTVRGQRLRTVVAAGILMAIGFLILSWAGAFTGGASEGRFSSTDTTNRTELAAAELKVFYEHPFFGVGVGMLSTARGVGGEIAPHTEYTRLLAEHGIAGLAAVVVLAALSVRIIRSGHGWFRMASAGLVVMSLADMSHSATRIGCIAFGFGIAALSGDNGSRDIRASVQATDG